jgi:hypothetical protein
VRLGAVLLGYIDVVSQQKTMRPSRNKSASSRDDGSEEERFSTWPRDGPEGKRERVACSAQQMRPVLAQAVSWKLANRVGRMAVGPPVAATSMIL